MQDIWKKRGEIKIFVQHMTAANSSLSETSAHTGNFQHNYK